MKIDAKDFETVSWQKIIEDVKVKECQYYFTPLSNALKETKDETTQKVLTTLMQISSFHFKADNVHEPYGAMMIMGGTRSAIPEDLSDEQLCALEEKIDTFDVDMKARIADVIWLRKRKFPMALVAIEAYIEASEYLLNNSDTWVHAFECIERAFRLAKSLGSGATVQYEDALEKIQSYLKQQGTEEIQYFSLKLMELLREAEVKNFETLAQLSESLAKNHEDQGQLHGAIDYWINAAYLYMKVEQNDKVQECQVNAAECYVKIAEYSDSAMVGANWLQKAIELYRRIGGYQSRTDELYEQLLQTQKQMASELHQVSTDVDLTKLVEHAISTIKNKSIQEAIETICLLSKPQTVASLRESVEQLVKEHPMQFLVSNHIMDSEGKTIAIYPDMMDPAQKEEAMEAHMMNRTQFQRIVSVNGSIEPARKRLLLEHNISISDLMPYVSNNPLIPVGREYVVAKGLLYGFYGEWMEATNILIPQFEEAVRYILKQNGEVVSGLDAKNLQDDRSLNTTLNSKLLEKIFGKDLVFELKALLINRFGVNLRNRISHGLMHTNEYYGYDTIYFWWLYLRLICWPALVERQKSVI